MIALADIPELLADLESGELTLRETHEVLLDLLTTSEVVDVMTCLPDALQRSFGMMLRDDFDSDVPASSTFWIVSSVGEHPNKASIVEAARRWLREQRGRD